MNGSRRGMIIRLLNEGKSDSDVLRSMDKAFPPGIFATTNLQALYGTKRDLGLHVSSQVHQKTASRPRAGAAPAVYSRDALVKALQSFHPDPVIECYVQNDLVGKSPNEIVSFTMGRSICRAFHHESPSERYRTWRWYGHGESIIENLTVIETQETFDCFALDLGKSLVADWGPKSNLGEPSRMNIGVAMKIVNLLLKHLSFSGHCGQKKVIAFLHVPWDSFTLSPLRGIWTGAPPLPESPTQGFVKNLETYQQLHALITDITREASVPRITYEFWAWDAVH